MRANVTSLAKVTKSFRACRLSSPLRGTTGGTSRQHFSLLLIRGVKLDLIGQLSELTRACRPSAKLAHASAAVILLSHAVHCVRGRHLIVCFARLAGRVQPQETLQVVANTLGRRHIHLLSKQRVQMFLLLQVMLIKFDLGRLIHLFDLCAVLISCVALHKLR